MYVVTWQVEAVPKPEPVEAVPKPEPEQEATERKSDFKGSESTPVGYTEIRTML